MTRFLSQRRSRLKELRLAVQLFFLLRASLGLLVVLSCAAHVNGYQTDDRDPSTNSQLKIDSIADLPDALGVAGPIVGFHDVESNAARSSPNFLLVAGGANFGRADDPDLWTLPKLFLDHVHVLERKSLNDETTFTWREDIGGEFRLSQPVAYSSVVSTRFGVLVIGGQNADGLTDRCFLLRLTGDDGDWKLSEDDPSVPDLPAASTAGGAAIIGDYVYAVGGQVAAAEETPADQLGAWQAQDLLLEGDAPSASRLVWRLNLDTIDPGNPDSDATWEQVVSWPDEPDQRGPRRMFPLVAAQDDGFTDRLFVMGGADS